MRSKHLLSVTLAVFVVVFAYADYTLNANQTAVTPPTQTPPPTSSSYTLANVAQHNSATSCWSAISGKVYDLTGWINQHPGGPGHILALCGSDGSAAFNAQHGGQSRPAQELARFYIGDLAQ
jgi:cytochrome b involved in lipid metabolism